MTQFGQQFGRPERIVGDPQHQAGDEGRVIMIFALILILILIQSPYPFPNDNPGGEGRICV